MKRKQNEEHEQNEWKHIECSLPKIPQITYHLIGTFICQKLQRKNEEKRTERKKQKMEIFFEYPKDRI